MYKNSIKACINITIIIVSKYIVTNVIIKICNKVHVLQHSISNKLTYVHSNIVK